FVSLRLRCSFYLFFFAARGFVFARLLFVIFLADVFVFAFVFIRCVLFFVMGFALALIRLLEADFGLRVNVSASNPSVNVVGCGWSVQPWASRTATMAARISFQVLGFLSTSFGNMQPSQQMWRKALVGLPFASRSQ